MRRAGLGFALAALVMGGGFVNFGQQHAGVLGATQRAREVAREVSADPWAGVRKRYRSKGLPGIRPKKGARPKAAAKAKRRRLRAGKA